MRDGDKTREQLLEELAELRRRFEAGEGAEQREIRKDLERVLEELERAEKEKSVALALERVRNEILQMEQEGDWGTVASCLHRELLLLIRFHECSINIAEKQDQFFNSYGIEADGTPDLQIIPMTPAIQQVLQSGAPVYRSNRAEIEQFEDDAALQTCSIVDVPFMGGTLAINSREEGAFDEREIRILSRFAPSLSEAYRRLQEIVNRKQTEQELVRLERLRAVGELSAGISHNLNNILTSVLGPARLLQRKTDDPELLREVDDIVVSALRARDLVHELHLFVREDKQEFLHSVSVVQIVQQAVQTSRPRWKDESEARGVLIKADVQWEDALFIQGTEEGLHDIFTNLIFNAVDAMPKGGTITIRIRRMEQKVQITFSDTGTGMDEATKLRIFEPFFTTKMDIGTGLGLSMVYNAVNRWGGTIAVNSTPGIGTTFILRFSESMEEKVEVEEEGEIGIPSARGGKIFIIDDEEAVCSLLARLLEEHHEVEAITDGQRVLDWFTPGEYDVVMIDLGMPGVPGDQLLEQLKKIDPLVVSVLITGWMLPETDVRVASFDFHLQKPFDDLDRVEYIVARAIELHDERVARGS
jgi:signal transduction histidine kinase